MSRWKLRWGDLVTRATLEETIGSPVQPGIAASRRSPHVVLVHRSSVSPVDGWRSDGYFYYLGSHRDQDNKPVLSAWEEGRTLHVLDRLPPVVGAKPLNRYIDSFVLEGVIKTDGMGCCTRGTRHVVFKLKTVHELTHSPGQMLAPGDPRVVDVRRVERCDLLCRDLPGHRLDAQRPETALSKAFERHLMQQGHAVHRLGIRHREDCSPLLTDTWVGSLRLLIEAKARSAHLREDLRMAIGQLADYSRFVPDVRRAILLPCEPEGDLIDLASSQQADLVWPAAGRWVTTAAWYRQAGLELFAGESA